MGDWWIDADARYDGPEESWTPANLVEAFESLGITWASIIKSIENAFSVNTGRRAGKSSFAEELEKTNAALCSVPFEYTKSVHKKEHNHGPRKSNRTFGKNGNRLY